MELSFVETPNISSPSEIIPKKCERERSKWKNRHKKKERTMRGEE
jgi:hypothetical protein